MREAAPSVEAATQRFLLLKAGACCSSVLLLLKRAQGAAHIPGRTDMRVMTN